MKKENLSSVYKTFSEHTSIGLMIINTQTKIPDFVNPAACTMFGYNENEFRKLDITRIHPPGNAGEILKCYKSGIQGTVSSITNIPCLRKDNSVFHADISYEKISNKDAEYLMISLTSPTIHQAPTDDLIIKEKVIASAIHGIAILDLNGKITYANRSYALMWGYDHPREIEGMHISDFAANGKADEVIEALLRTGIWAGEAPARKQDGSTFTVYISTNLVLDKTGKALCFIGYFVDITRRKQADEALFHSNEQLRLLIENIPGIMLTIQRDGTIWFFNRPSPVKEAVVGQKIYDFILPDYNQQARETIEKVYNNRIPGRFQAEVKTVDRGVLWFDILVVPIQKDGKVFSLLLISSDISDRKEYEFALNESEERFHSVIDNIAIGISVINQNMEITATNRQMKSWFPGIDLLKKPICYQTFNEPPLDTLCSYCPTCKTLQDGAIHEDIAEKSVGDETRHYRIIATPIKDSSGAVISAIELVQDITEQRKALAKLHESEERYRLIAENQTDVIWTTDLNFKMIYVSPSVQELRDYTPEDVMQQSIDEYLTPHSLMRAMNLLSEEKDNIEKGIFEPKTIDLELIKKDGSIVLTETKLSIIYDEHGKAQYILGVSRDITDRKKSEERLRFLSSFVEQSSDGMAVANLNGIMLYANQTWVQMHGYELANELTGQHLSSFHNTEQIENEVIPFNKKVLEKGAHTGEIGHTRKDGTQFPTLMTTTLLKNEQGENFAFAGTARDITRIKELQHQLEQSNRDLKDATEHLIQTEKMTALGELTAGISHELNQPLNSIKIICQSLIRDMEHKRLDTTDALDDLTEAIKQVDKMAEIIGHMRIFTIDSNNQMKDAVDINPIARAPFSILGQQMVNKGIEIVMDLTEKLPNVIADPIRLEQVFINMITNARKTIESSGKDKKRIDIRTYKLSKEKSVLGRDSIAIEIQDNGAGIPKTIQRKLFQPFFTTDQPGNGIGLGLSVSAKIIEEHKGRIEIESKVGIGTTFRILLPVPEE